MFTPLKNRSERGSLHLLYEKRPSFTETESDFSRPISRLPPSCNVKKPDARLCGHIFCRISKIFNHTKVHSIISVSIKKFCNRTKNKKVTADSAGYTGDRIFRLVAALSEAHSQALKSRSGVKRDLFACFAL